MDERIWQERLLRDAVAAGDDAAWRILYERGFDGAHTFVRGRTGQRADRAEEVLQETWMVALRRIKTFDPERGPFVAWVIGIAALVLKNQQRRWERRDRVEGTTLDERIAPTQPERSPSDASAHTELQHQIAVAMSTLPANYRDVLRWKYHDGRPVNEIATATGRTPKSVESMLVRARDAFRRAFDALDAHMGGIEGP